MKGTGRYNRIREAVDAGATGPPIDMRYIKRTEATTPESTSECISFLEGIYESVAETLPDIRDHSMDISLRELADKSGDAYSANINVTTKPKQKLKGPREFKKRIRVMRDRKKEVRHLPPGRMKDYYEQMLALSSRSKPVASFATFYRVPRPPIASIFCLILQGSQVKTAETVYYTENQGTVH